MDRPDSTYGYLPHMNGTLVFVTFRLADSLPLHALKEIKDFENAWYTKYKSRWTNEIEEDLRRKRVLLENTLLDKALGSCLLRNARVRQLLVETMMHFDEVHYRLHAFVVMPNHVHLLIHPFDGYRVQDIIHSMKTYSSRQINALLNRTGKLWQREYYDRYIRNERHYWSVMRYIESNPCNCKVDEFFYYKRDWK